MKVLSIKEIKDLGKSIKINVDDEFCLHFQKEIKYINILIKKLQELNLANYEMMNYPCDEVSTFLRDDDEIHHIDKKKILNNSYHNGDLITIGRVVKK